MASGEASGGFTLSPPLSSVSSSLTPSSHSLPHPRDSPLRPGGAKESAFIRHVDQRILHIQRRFAKRTTDASTRQPWMGDVQGYTSMREACKDIEDLVGVAWVSGTPSLQIPYLINLAMMLSQVIAEMSPSPRALFRVLGKLDHAFASLIQGRDVNTGERLPGFEGKGMNGTEKVRVRSLVERTRVGVVEAFKKGEFEDEMDEMDVDEDEDEDGLVLENPAEDDDEVDESMDMQLARVYDRTVQELGDSLEAPSIGVVTEKRG